MGMRAGRVRAASYAVAASGVNSTGKLSTIRQPPGDVEIRTTGWAGS